ncbi:hypothetical protein NPIL_114531, partial [Nephila pilipes]
APCALASTNSHLCQNRALEKICFELASSLPVGRRLSAISVRDFEKSCCLSTEFISCAISESLCSYQLLQTGKTGNPLNFPENW